MGLDEKARAAVLDHLAQRGGTESHHGLAARHRLLGGQGKALEQRGEHEDVGEVEHGHLVRLGEIAGEDHRAVESELLHQRLQLGPEGARPDPDQAHVVARGAADLREGLDEEGGILPRHQGSEGEEHSLPRDVPAPGEGLVPGPRCVLRPYPAVDDLHVIGADPELLGELALGELAVRDHAVRGLDDALLEHGIEGARIEVMVMGHHGHGQPIVVTSPQRGRAH